MDDVTHETIAVAFRLLLQLGRPLTAQIRLQFAAGQPPATPVVVFFPDDRGSARTIDDWCSNANFFETREAALSWSTRRKREGEVIDLEEARHRSLAHWTPVLSANREIKSREEHGDNG